MQQLPSQLYKVKTVTALEQQCIRKHGIPGYTLMRRAGQAVLDLIREKFPEDITVLILCGAGNNAGDGYVVARLAQQSGYQVKLLSLIDPQDLSGDARQAWLHWIQCGEVSRFSSILFEQYYAEAQLVVDAMLGTGLSREVSGDWRQVIETLNQKSLPVISVDIPSGLDADSGCVWGVAVRADYTMTFIGMKTGLFTAAGRQYAGQIRFNTLAVPDSVFQHFTSDARLLNDLRSPLLAARPMNAHKGMYGHVLIVGGNFSMAGAVILAAKAALRSGAGLVSVFTRAEHCMTVTSACPEVMVTASDASSGEVIPAALLERASHIAIGPGMGQDDWANACLQQCLQSGKPMVVDADALNLLAKHSYQLLSDCVITPHPGEAARLLQCDIKTISKDRFSAIRSLHRKIMHNKNMVVVLKGSGSLVFDGKKMSVNPYGNPAMATAGMGDVLTGVMIACLGQGLTAADAAINAVVAHSMAGDMAAKGKSRGVLASDVIQHLPEIL